VKNFDPTAKVNFWIDMLALKPKRTFPMDNRSKKSQYHLKKDIPKHLFYICTCIQ